MLRLRNLTAIGPTSDGRDRYSRAPRVQLLALAAALVLLLPAGWAQEKKPRSDVELSKEEQFVLDRTNEARAKESLSPLKPNKILMQAARNHSSNMARQGRMEHELDGKTPADRASALGYVYQNLGENIASGLPLSPEDAIKTWMKSEGHRKNILGKEYQEIGIGIARNARGETYYTQVFGRPRQ